MDMQIAEQKMYVPCSPRQSVYLRTPGEINYI